MRNDGYHTSDHDLLRAVDGELSSREASRVHAHLKACWKCRARGSELERAIAAFVVAYHRERNEALPGISGPRALLQARLRELQFMESTSHLQRLRQWILRVPAVVYAGIAICAVGLIGVVPYFSAEQVQASSVPNSTLTPGATRTASRDELCPARPTEGFYPIPVTLASRVFEKYGIHNPRPRTYEVDYLITPALGGADDIRNLWPQPFETGEWNAHIKDALEDHLHEQVCADKLDLATVQRDIASNWIAAYQKYFKTDQPLSIHATFSIDPPWDD